MSEQKHEHGAGKTGGLPGQNADPGNSEISPDELDEVLPAEVADDGTQRNA
jgi:hypothetical protein